MFTSILIAIAPAVAFVGSIGLGTWAALILLDTVVGMLVRSGNGGVWSWSYIQTFLVKNFATTEARVMAGLVFTAGTSAVLTHLLSGNSAALFQTFFAASVAAFVAGVATQDAALVKDIVAKLTGQTTGQLARRARERPVEHLRV